MFEAYLMSICCAAQRIPGRKSAAAIMAMAWVQDARRGTWRLFTGDVDGLLVEWDLVSLRPLASTDSFGGAIWAIEQQPSGGSSKTGAHPRFPEYPSAFT